MYLQETYDRRKVIKINNDVRGQQSHHWLTDQKLFNGNKTFRM
jgi:hypothetical protein